MNFLRWYLKRRYWYFDSACWYFDRVRWYFDRVCWYFDRVCWYFDSLVFWTLVFWTLVFWTPPVMLCYIVLHCVMLCQFNCPYQPNCSNCTNLHLTFGKVRLLALLVPTCRRKHWLDLMKTWTLLALAHWMLLSCHQMLLHWVYTIHSIVYRIAW